MQPQRPAAYFMPRMDVFFQTVIFLVLCDYLLAAKPCRRLLVHITPS